MCLSSVYAPITPTFSASPSCWVATTNREWSTDLTATPPFAAIVTPSSTCASAEVVTVICWAVPPMPTLPLTPSALKKYRRSVSAAMPASATNSTLDVEVISTFWSSSAVTAKSSSGRVFSAAPAPTTVDAVLTMFSTITVPVAPKLVSSSLPCWSVRDPPETASTVVEVTYSPMAKYV